MCHLQYNAGNVIISWIWLGEEKEDAENMRGNCLNWSLIFMNIRLRILRLHALLCQPSCWAPEDVLICNNNIPQKSIIVSHLGPDLPTVVINHHHLQVLIIPIIIIIIIIVIVIISQ